LDSNIDIALSTDPSICKYITVLSSELPSPSLLAPLLRPKMDPQVIYEWDCCCFNKQEKGAVSFRAAIDRTYLIAGDVVSITAFAQNSTEDTCKFVINLRQLVMYESNGGERIHFYKEYELAEDVVPAGGMLEWSTTNPKKVTIPAVPPTFRDSGSTAYDPLT
jgi:hypothetical protein